MSGFIYNSWKSPITEVEADKCKKKLIEDGYDEKDAENIVDGENFVTRLEKPSGGPASESMRKIFFEMFVDDFFSGDECEQLRRYMNHNVLVINPDGFIESIGGDASPAWVKVQIDDTYFIFRNPEWKGNYICLMLFDIVPVHVIY